MKRRRNRPQAAFTLIELVLVALIIMMIIGLSMPMFRKTYLALAAREASYGLVKLASYARENAAIKNKSYKLKFDFEEGRYQLLVSDAGQAPEKYKKADGMFGRVFKLPDGISFKGADGEVMFYPDGSSGATSITIGSKEELYAVTIKGSGVSIEPKGNGK